MTQQPTRRHGRLLRLIRMLSLGIRSTGKNDPFGLRDQFGSEIYLEVIMLSLAGAPDVSLLCTSTQDYHFSIRYTCPLGVFLSLRSIIHFLMSSQDQHHFHQCTISLQTSLYDVLKCKAHQVARLTTFSIACRHFPFL